jgi:hypothetical protein
MASEPACSSVLALLTAADVAGAQTVVIPAVRFA